MAQSANSLIDWLIKIGISKQLNSNDILNGITVNSVLHRIVPNYNTQISQNNTALNRVNNWNTLIKQLDAIAIKVNTNDKNRILQGDDKMVYNILAEIKTFYDHNREEVDVDINKIDARGDPKNSKSLLQLFILVIVKHFGFNVKQAVALLSNDSKYLAHILAKGFKDSYKPVENLLLDILKLMNLVTLFCKNKENETFFIKSLKPGLISKFQNISLLTIEIMTEFIKNLPQRYEITRDELLSTMILSLKRHKNLTRPAVKCIIDIIGFNKNIIGLLMAHAEEEQIVIMILGLMQFAQDEGKLHQFYEMFKVKDYIQKSIEHLRNNQMFINSMTFLLKVGQTNYGFLVQTPQSLSKIVHNLLSLQLSKKTFIMVHINQLFSLLHLFGKRKNQLAPTLYKLLIQKFKQTYSQDESHNYLLNFKQIIEVFPSIPSSLLTQVIIYKYQNSIAKICELQFSIIEIAIQDQIQEKLTLKIFNVISKIFVEEVGYIKNIADIITTMVKNFQSSKIIFDLTVKFIKICLAIHYANVRKLNYSKSLIGGSIKLDKSNAFYKAKNMEIQDLLRAVIEMSNQGLNKTLEPYVCYSYFQSQLKNKQQADNLREVMCLFGNEVQLRTLYEKQAKLLLDEKNDGKKVKDEPAFQLSKPRSANKIRANSDATLLTKKKDYISSKLSHISNISYDAQKGLQKYTKGYLQKMAKLSLEQQKKLQQEQKFQNLQKLFSHKVLQKGMNISKQPQKQFQYLFQFNSKQKSILKDEANDFSYLHFYDPQSQEERDIKGLGYLMKKYQKVLKIYYHNYGGKLRPNTVKLFEDISQRHNLMQSAGAWKMLRDHDLDQYITVKEVQFIVQKLNANLKKQYKDSSYLDYEIFQKFIIQAAMTMFSRAPKDMRSHPISDMVQQVINKFKQNAHLNKIDLKMFQQNFLQGSVIVENTQIRDLNQKLRQNPDYIVPEGYKKIVNKTVSFTHLFNLDSLSEQYQDAYEILDQIIFENLGFNIIEPYSQIKTVAIARPVLYQTQSIDLDKRRSVSTTMNNRYELRAPYIKKGEEGEGQNKEGSSEFNPNSSLDQNQLLHSRLQNKFQKIKKEKQEEKKKRQEEQERKREQRNKQIKALLEKHKQKVKEQEDEKQKQKEQQQKRQEQQRKRKQKYQENLKKKVEEYMEKKKKEKNSQENEEKERKKRQKELQQKLKVENEQKKKMVQDAKKKKYQQEKQRDAETLLKKKKKQEQQKRKKEQKQEQIKQMLQDYRKRKESKEKPKKAKIELP